MSSADRTLPAWRGEEGAAWPGGGGAQLPCRAGWLLCEAACCCEEAGCDGAAAGCVRGRRLAKASERVWYGAAMSLAACAATSAGL